MLYINAKPGDKLNLGRKGENLARTILFDISQWRKLYGDGVVALLHQRAGDAAPYPCNIETDGNTVAWAITNADTAVASQYGKYELQYRVDDQLAKSATGAATGAASVYESLGESTAEPPEAQQGWVDKVLQAGAEATASASAAAQSKQAAAEYAEQAQSAIGRLTTFDIIPETGELMMYKSEGYTGPAFSINEYGELEVEVDV